MKKIFDFLFSTKLMAVLFLVFAVTMAVATFIESGYGTPTARKLVYASWWFEMIMFIFVINFIGNIFKYRLLRPKKWPVLLFHLAFLFILIGAWVTRYISYEGQMPILEGVTTNKFLTQKVYISVADGNQELIIKPIIMSKLGSNAFRAKSQDGAVEINFDKFIPNAHKTLIPDDNAPLYLHLVESTTGQRLDHFLTKDSVLQVAGQSIYFNNDLAKPGIHIFDQGGTLKILTPVLGTSMVMRTQENRMVTQDSLQDFNLRSLYQIGAASFIIPEAPSKGRIDYVSGDKNIYTDDVVQVNLTANGETKKVAIKGRQYNTGTTVATVGGKSYAVAYGSRNIELPFTIKLRDFQLTRNPGSMSPKSFASEITVDDQEQNKKFDFRIFMNNILNYRGYKFFQSSYSITPQGEQTVLSVNHDKLGTILTYIGYTLLYLGLILIMILPGTRFSDLRHKLRKLQNKGAAIVVLLLMFGGPQAFAQTNNIDIDTILNETVIPESHAEIFGKLVIQDAGGRMKPANTYSSELLRKLTKSETYHGYNSDQILASMVLSPKLWYYAPIIYIKKRVKGIRPLLGIPEDQKYARLTDFFSSDNKFKLRKEAEEANKRRIKSVFDKEIIAVDQRVNLLLNALDPERGLRLFPLKDSPTNKWYSANNAQQVFAGDDSLYVANIFPLYVQTMMKAKEDGNDSLAVALLNSINKFQHSYGAAVMPSDKQLELEIMYNKYDIFKKLFSYYMYIGTLLFLFVIFHIFKEGKVTKWLINISMVIILVLFGLHTAGLGVRWYISGHAPWSSAYESMIYIAWATMLFGLIFGRKSPLTMGAAAFLTSMMLMIAHWSWADPEIGNLVPVLNSYWLMIHVSMIVASYGPFALSMILGITSMVFMILTTDKNKTHLAPKIKELTYINEMSMTVGLVLLTIGNFLGGQWANESWGRYWGWDPKETWALISIMVYAFVLHMRLVPGLRGRFTFNFLSVLSFASILMTYFGVNFYLAGLHSYAKGDAPQTPSWAYYFLAIVLGLAVASYASYRKHYQK